MWIMTLPAEILLSMHKKIDLWRALNAGVFTVAFPAECPVDRYRRCNQPWRFPVRIRHLMTSGAIEQNMRRKRLCSCDLGVARLAFVRKSRWPRVMRAVASDARLQRVVSGRIYLRKTGWTRRIVGMATSAMLAQPRHSRVFLHRILCMLTRRSMAGFTRKVPVIALLHYSVLIMAVRTDVRSRVADRSCRFSLNRRFVIQCIFCQSRGEKETQEKHASRKQKKDDEEPFDLLWHFRKKSLHLFPRVFTPTSSCNGRRLQEQLLAIVAIATVHLLPNFTDVLRVNILHTTE